MSSTWGQAFRVTTWGESHGQSVGAVIDGCPAGIKIDLDQIQSQLNRRRPGQSKLVSTRNEADELIVLSGLEEGVSLGTPIALMVANQDARPKDYSEMREKFRPSHADFTYFAKYGLKASSGGGRASARETIGRVLAGSIAEQFLASAYGTRIVAWVERVQDVLMPGTDPISVDREMVDQTAVRCPDLPTAERMIEKIEAVRKQGNTVGGAIFACAQGVPAGWGEPVFDKLEAELAKAMLSLPAAKAFESGSGFAGTYWTGSENNDAIRSEDGKHAFTTTNHSGGIQGGISNGMPIFVRVGFKPVATIMQTQDTITTEFENTTLHGRGRHDACVLPRAVPMVEAMMAIVLADHALRQQRQGGLS